MTGVQAGIQVLRGRLLAAWRGGGHRVSCLGGRFCARPAAAETLVEALSNAYLINPVSMPSAQISAPRRVVAVAKSGLRPGISASGDAAFRNQESDVVGGSRSNQAGV